MGQVKARLLSQTELALQLVDAAAPVGETNLTADEIDSLIIGLGQLRMAMKPEVAHDLPPGIQTNTVVDPLKMVSLRHPGRGWFMFGLSLPEAAKLAHALLAALPPELGGQSPPRSSLH